MKVLFKYASLNAIILISILLLSTLSHSDLGGMEATFNSISLLLALIFIFLNFKFNQFLILSFSLPLFFLTISVIVNNDVFDSGGYHRVISMTIGYLLLMLGSFDLNKSLLERGVFIYLLLAIFFSIGLYVTNFSNHNAMVLIANSNFNGNPNAASLFFFTCLVLSVVFLKERARWAFMGAFVILILTTASRTGAGVAITLYFVFILFGNEGRNSLKMNVFIEKKTYRNILLFMIMIGMLYTLVPNSFSVLETRLSTAGLDLSSSTLNLGRAEIWESAFELLSGSLKAQLFGAGPGTAIILVGRGMHSSYVDAIVSVGWLFLIATLFAIAFLFYYHKKRGQYYFIFFAILILIYGAFETTLFNGMGSIWWLFIFLSLYYRSFDSSNLELSVSNQRINNDCSRV
jgi:hypothetical protein